VIQGALQRTGAGIAFRRPLQCADLVHVLLHVHRGVRIVLRFSVPTKERLPLRHEA